MAHARLGVVVGSFLCCKNAAIKFTSHESGDEFTFKSWTGERKPETAGYETWVQ